MVARIEISWKNAIDYFVNNNSKTLLTVGLKIIKAEFGRNLKDPL